MRPSVSSSLSCGTSPVAWGELLACRVLRVQPRYIPSRLGRARRSSRTDRAAPVHPQSPGESSDWPAFLSSLLGTSPVAWGERHQLEPRAPEDRYIPSRLGRAWPLATRWSGASVHPQSPGESPMRRCSRCSLFGTSPVAWGELWRLGGLLERVRYIPSRLGRALPRGRTPCARPVHPQSPGESVTLRTKKPDGTGTSPVAWGEPAMPLMRPATERYIPSRLGRAWWRDGRRRGRPVHPQSPGESGIGLAGRDETRGTSPVAWGEPAKPHPQDGHRRYIPSRLGRAACPLARRGALTVHPQSPGESRLEGAIAQCSLGTSPVAWGEHPHPHLPSGCARYIPSRLGRAREADGGGEGLAVHPQSPGESEREGVSADMSRGTSPVAWGERDGLCAAARGMRYIPSRLGRATCSATALARPAVHPQSPGESRQESVQAALSVGTSPVAWGERRHSVRCHTRGRYIPSRLGRARLGGRAARGGAVHPQSPGESIAVLPKLIDLLGTSPVAWGEPDDGTGAMDRVRYIPSRLGRAPPPHSNHALAAVHPQSPGESDRVFQRAVAFPGTSPVAWGERLAA